MSGKPRVKLRSKTRLFSPEQCLALYALSNGCKPADVAWYCGRGKSTVHRWLQDEWFASTLDRMIQDRVDETTALRFIISDPNADAAAKLRAMERLSQPDEHPGIKELERFRTSQVRSVVAFVRQRAVAVMSGVG